MLINNRNLAKILIKAFALNGALSGENLDCVANAVKFFSDNDTDTLQAIAELMEEAGNEVLAQARLNKEPSKDENFNVANNDPAAWHDWE